MQININHTPVNHDSGRAGRTVTGIVIHTIVGTLQSAENRFFNPSAQVSANYGIGLNGEIRQWVAETDTAYCNGNYQSNLSTISIEHEDNGDYNGPRTPELYNASSELVADICRRYNLACNRDTIKGHNEVIDKRYYPGGTACPDQLDIDRIINEANAKIEAANHPAPAPVATPEPQHAPAVAVSQYSRFDSPLKLKTNKQPTNMYNLDGASWGVLGAAVVKSFDSGTEFIAVGKAKHPLGGVYYMTAYSFGNADVTGTPDHNNGVNSVDLTLDDSVVTPAPVQATVATPTPVSEPSAAVISPDAVNVTVIHAAPDAWKNSFKINKAGQYGVKTAIKITDLDNPEAQPLALTTVNADGTDRKITILGTFVKDNVEYYKPKLKSYGDKQDHWYGIPVICLDDGDYDIDKDIMTLDLNLINEAKVYYGRLSNRAKAVKKIATIERIAKADAQRINFLNRFKK